MKVTCTNRPLGVRLLLAGATVAAAPAEAGPCGVRPEAIAAKFSQARESCAGDAVAPGPAATATAPARQPVSITFAFVLPAEAAGTPAFRTRRGPARPAPLIAAVGTAYRIDPALLHAIVRRESRFSPAAVSPKGALGLMQLMPGTARELGVDNPDELLRDPLLNLETGARYLKRMQARFGNNLPLVLAAYNAGPGAVQRHGGVPPYSETRAYVASILADYRAASRGAAR